MFARLFNQKAAPVSVSVDTVNNAFRAGRERSVPDNDFSGYVLLAVGVNRLFNSRSARTYLFLTEPEAKAPTDPDDESAYKYPTASGMFMTVHSPRPDRLGLAFILRNPTPDRSVTYFKNHMILGLDGHLIGTPEAPTHYEIRRIILPVFNEKNRILAQRDIPVTRETAYQTMEYAKNCLTQMTEGQALTPARNQKFAGIFMTPRKAPGS